jgi:drug/metabolite transporter (DMT)-like permease
MTEPAVDAGSAARYSRLEAKAMPAVILASACWATSGIFVKLIAADTGMTALSLAFWRDITTFVVLVAGIGLVRPGWLRVDRRDLGWLAALGASLGIFHVFWNLGVMFNGAAVATVQQAAMPAIVTVAAWFIWREPLTVAKLLAILLTFVGTVLVSGIDPSGHNALSIGGLLVGIAIPVMYASWNLLAKKVRPKHNPFTSLTYAFAFAALVLLPPQLLTHQTWNLGLSSILWFAGLIGLATIAGFWIYILALGRLPASVATILAMSEIVFVAVYAYLLLDERLTTGQLLGAVLVVVGVLVLSLSRPTGRTDLSSSQCT